MTFSFAHEITLHETNDHDVCVSILSKKAFAKTLIPTMEGLGYRKIRTESERVGIVQLYDIDDADDVFTVVAD